METHYRPVIDDVDEAFDPSRLSAFVELQKPGIKQALFQAGFSESDFSRWVDERKLTTLNQTPISGTLRTIYFLSYGELVRGAGRHRQHAIGSGRCCPS